MSTASLGLLIGQSEQGFDRFFVAGFEYAFQELMRRSEKYSCIRPRNAAGMLLN
jgi:hypothetical protein